MSDSVKLERQFMRIGNNSNLLNNDALSLKSIVLQ